MLREYNSGKNTQLNTKIHFPVGIAKEVRCHCKPQSAKVVQKIARQPAPCRWHRNVKTMAQNIVASYGIVPCLKVNVSKQLSHWTSTVSTHFFYYYPRCWRQCNGFNQKSTIIFAWHFTLEISSEPQLFELRIQLKCRRANCRNQLEYGERETPWLETNDFLCSTFRWMNAFYIHAHSSESTRTERRPLYE